MKSRILLLSIVALSNANVIKVSPNETVASDESPNETVASDIANLNKVVLNAAYRKKYKEMLTDYVLCEYNDLTYMEKDKVGDIIEEFLQDVTMDFKMILDGDLDEDVQAVKRIGDPQFDKIYKHVFLSLPNIDDCVALNLAYRIEKNVTNARRKIEKVIKDSKIALTLNSVV